MGPLEVQRGDPAKASALRGPAGGQKGKPFEPRGGPGRPVRVGEAQGAQQNKGKPTKNKTRKKTKKQIEIGRFDAYLGGPGRPPSKAPVARQRWGNTKTSNFLKKRKRNKKNTKNTRYALRTGVAATSCQEKRGSKKASEWGP